MESVRCRELGRLLCCRRAHVHQRAAALWRRALAAAAVLTPCVAGSEPARITIERLATINVPAFRQEIIAWCPRQRLLLATNPHAGEISVYEAPRTDPPELIPLDFDETLSGPQGIPTVNAPTSVAIHPTQPVAMVTVLGDHAADRGRVNFYDLRAVARGRWIHSQIVGYHPDSIAVSPDGQWAMIANEGEGHPGTPGTITIIDLRGWTVDRTWPEGGLPAREIRPPARRLDASPGEIEPEYVAFDPTSRLAAVSLQENDAVLLLDMQAEPQEVGGIVYLPAGAQPDGVALLDGAAGEPDGLLLVVAEEGVFDRVGRIRGHALSLWSIHPDRLERPTLLSRVELRALFGKKNRPAKRIDPESVALLQFGGRTLAFVTLERLDLVAVFDVSDPKKPILLGDLPTGAQPEGLIVVPSGDDLIVITGDEGGYDGPGEITFGRVRVGEDK